MSGALTFRHFGIVTFTWLAIAAVAWLLASCVSGATGRVGLDVVSPLRLISLEIRSRGWGEPALDEAETKTLDSVMEHQRRVLAAGIVGMALAAAGVTLQALLRNALADPYILGISSGSTVGVAAWRLLPVLWPSAFSAMPLVWLAVGRSIPAVIGALATCVLVFVLAHRRGGAGGGMQPVTLLLVGVVISAVNGALLMLLSILRTSDMNGMAFYLIGNISENDLTRSLMWVALGAFLLGYLPVLLSAAALNVGTLSDTQAISLGVNVQRLRMLCFVCASVMTASAILLSGPIGFVGLICPHICRRLRAIGGADHRTLLIAAPLCGAAFLMLADALANAALTFNHGALPVGIVTAFCGGPFFLYLLRRGGGAGGRGGA